MDYQEKTTLETHRGTPTERDRLWRENRKSPDEIAAEAEMG